MSFKPNWSKIMNRKVNTDVSNRKPVKRFNEEEYYRKVKQKIDDLFDKDHDLDDVFASLKERPKLDLDDIEEDETDYEDE